MNEEASSNSGDPGEDWGHELDIMRGTADFLQSPPASLEHVDSSSLHQFDGDVETILPGCSKESERV